MPIVALIDAASPIDAVLAQAAGADVVLPTTGLQGGSHDHVPGLALARRAATAIAHRRSEIARSSRRAGHDLAEALNVIALAAGVGSSGAIDPHRALDQIGALAVDAGSDAWRAGRAHRASGRPLTLVDVARLVDGPDVDVRGPAIERWVLADERQLTSVLAELIEGARRSGAARVVVAIGAGSSPEQVDIVVSNHGTHSAPDLVDEAGASMIPPSRPASPGLGPATVDEFVADMGGTLAALGTDESGRPVGFRLSLPVIDDEAGELARGPVVVDQATAQANILEGVVRHAPLAESLDAIVEAIEHQLPDTACSILLLSRSGTLHHGAAAKLPDAYRKAIDGTSIGPGQGSCGTAAYTGQPVIASDVVTDRNWVDFRDVATAHGLRSCWSTPIVAAEGGEVLGTFAVYKAKVWTPDQAAVRLIERFTYLAAVAIEHHRLFGALAESESRFRSAFEGATSGMALVQLDGTLIKVNPAMSTMLEPAERTMTANLLDLIDPAHRWRIADTWERLAARAEPVPADQGCIEVPLAAPRDGETVWVSLRTSIINDQNGDQRYLYVEVRDVSADRRHLEEQRARRTAEAANQAKTDFLALVSHELRTPLNAILGFAQVMQMVDLDPGQRTGGVEQIVRAGEHLRDLIDELLDLSRIEAGQLSVVAEAIDPTALVGEVLNLVRPLATSRDIELIDDLPPTGSPAIHADPRCLRQVLINLMGNAVKYTPIGGRVVVDVTTVSQGTVRIGVTDSGPGISSDSMAKLFQPFHRLERDGQSGPEGTGLGLALSARLMDEMNGRIGVESTPGTGSCFWIEFPRSRPDPAGGSTLPGRAPARSTGGDHAAQVVHALE